MTLQFSVTESLREINFGRSRSVKSAVFAILEAQNFDFYELLLFWRLKCAILTKWQIRISRLSEVDFT